MRLADEAVNAIAPQIHNTYNQLGIRAGWLKPEKAIAFDQLPTPADLKKKKQELEQPNLADDLRAKLQKEQAELEVAIFKRESNFAAARRISGILALVGLRLESATSTAAEEECAVRQHIEYHLARSPSSS